MYAIKDSFGILAIASVNVINGVMLVSILITKYVSVEKIVDKLAEECTGNVKEIKLAKITSAEDENKHKNKCSSSTL